MAVATGSVKRDILKQICWTFVPIWLIACNNSVTPPPAVSQSKWQIFTASNSPISNNYIHDISVDDQKRVWFATDNGAFYFDRSYWGATIRDSLCTNTGRDANCTVYSITQAKDRAIWFATAQGGVVRYQPNSESKVWTRYTERDSAFDHPLSLAGDHSSASLYGQIWVTSSQGVSQFTQSTNELGAWKRFRSGDVSNLPTNQVYVVKINPIDNIVWFGTATGGPVKAEYSTGGILGWTPIDIPVDLDSKINSIAFDLNDVVWFGTETRGIVVLDRANGSWGQYSQDSTRYRRGSPGHALPNVPVRAVVTDYARTRWFGTDSGLVRLSDSVWTRFTKSNSPLPSDTITALEFDVRGNLWIGTTSGIGAYNDGGLIF